ncbi:MAG: hypothetical protein K2P76_10280 [Lachnospiraceae bacterium]|nr:hypothetical protein [Lachnospiraceae bacterium]MDE6980274.1 hypothetical protein [Lachnospiraceae bacterium]
MTNMLEMVIPENEQEEIKEFISTLLLLPKEDRAMLLFSANAFKVRSDIEKAKCSQKKVKRKASSTTNAT